MTRSMAGLLMLISGTAIAQGPSYNYVSGFYIIDSEVRSASGDGFGVDLSFAPLEIMQVTLDYSARTVESGGIDFDFDFLSIGVGARLPLSEDGNLSLFGGISYEEFQGGVSIGGGGGGGGEEPPAEGEACAPTGTPLDILFSALNDLTGLPTCGPPFRAKGLLGSGNDTTDGYGAHVGIRALLADVWEVGAKVRYREYDDFDDTSYSLTGMYHLGALAFLVSYDSYQDFEIDEYYAGVRFNFGGGSGAAE